MARRLLRRLRIAPASGTAALGVVLLATASGCAHELYSGYQRLGVNRDSPDSIVIRYVACDDEPIEHVQLWLLDGDNVAFEDGDELIWEVFDPDRASLSRGVHPASPDGAPLRLDPDERYMVDIKTPDHAADSDGFELSDLRTEEVRVDRSFRSHAEYERRAQDSC